MLRKYKTGICFVCVSLAACAGPITMTESHEVESVAYPDIGTTVTSRPGDVLVVRSSKTTSPALRISSLTTFGKAEGESSLFYCGLTFQPGLAAKRGSVKYFGRSGVCFGPFLGSATRWDGTTSEMSCNGYTAQMDICQDTVDGTYFVYYPNNNQGPVVSLKQDFDNISKTEIVVSSASNFLKEIVYSAKKEDRLVFLYRESRGDLAEPSYEKEWDVQYGGQPILIQHAGASLKIIGADDDEIKYQVESNFQ